MVSLIPGHMLLGLQMMVVVGSSDPLPPLPLVYQSLYLSPGQAGVMGNVNNDTSIVDVYFSSKSSDPTWDNGKRRGRLWEICIILSL